jgi:glycosyltransferase involved in cell wall biosynthesis
MRILFIHNFYQQFGGEDSVAIAERRLLEERGENVLFWSRHNDEIKNYSPLQKLNFFRETIYSSRTVSDIEKAVSEFKPDIAFVHNIYPLISPSLYSALQKMRVPLVQVLHDFRPFCSNGWFYIDGKICERCKLGNHLHGIVKRCYRDSYTLSTLYSTALGVNRWAGMLDKVDAYVCLTGFFKKKIMEAGIPEKKIFIRPNFIDAPPLDNPTMNDSPTMNARPMDPQSTPNAAGYGLFLGRLSNEKGLWTLIRAFEQLPDVELKIVGTGPLEEELRKYVREKNLHNINLVGFKSGEEKWQLIRNCQFAVVSSEWYENFPIVVLEYFAGAKPVIASRIGGLPYVVEEGKSGLLFEAGNAADLADKVRKLRANPSEGEAMGRCGRQLAETEYGPQKSYDNLMQIFTQVLSAR